MSGGSFNNIQYKQVEDLLNVDGLEEVESMASVLDGFGQLGAKAAQKTRDVLQKLQALKAEIDRLDVEKAELYQIWKSVDYWYSMDSSEASVKEDLKIFNLE